MNNKGKNVPRAGVVPMAFPGYYLGEENRLDCFSINCWTQLKAKICLPIARLNDLGIGAGPFSIARSKKDIVLHESIETHDGAAVFYPSNRPGRGTACNLMGSRV